MESEIIPNGYNSYHAPVVNDLPVSVYTSCQITGIDEINEINMDFRVLLFLVTVWKDPRLNLNKIASNYPVIFPEENAHKIWKPLLHFPNSKQGKKIDMNSGQNDLKVLPDHSLYQITRLNFIVDCPMELHNFPMDIQTCDFLISLMVHADKEAILKWIGEEGSPYKYFESSIHIRHVNLLKFEMDEFKARKVKTRWINGNFTALIVEFKFIRQLTGNILNVYVPSTLVVMMSWLSFWLDVSCSPARITLGVTSILTLVMQLVQSRSYVPPADYLKAIDIWFLACIFLVFASLVEYALACESTKPESKPKTTSIRPLRSESKDKNIPEKTIKNEAKKYIEVKNANIYDRMAKIVFPTLFILFTIFYWIYYLHNRDYKGKL